MVRSLLTSHLRALALYPPPTPSHLSPRTEQVRGADGPGRPARLTALLLAVHLLLLALVCRLAHWSLWLAPLLLLLFCLPMLPARRLGRAFPPHGFGDWRGGCWPEALAPLGLLYALAFIRLGIVYLLRREAPEALDYGWGLGLSGLWSTLLALRAARRLRLIWAALGLASLLGWLALYGRILPAGVTGSDPLAYVLMAVDLAERGTPRHTFPLAPLAAGLGLPTLPTTHVGYVLPDAHGNAPTVWPPGFSVLLAAAYRAGGERALLWTNGLLGLAALALTGLLARELAPAGRRRAWALGAAALALLATSPEQLTRLAVPLADGAAQVFTLLALLLALWAGQPGQGRRMPLGALAGLALAATYSVRYTQVLAGPGLALILWRGGRTRRERLAGLAPFTLAAAIGALPDMLFRMTLYGAPWRFGTGELSLFSVRALPEALGRLGGELLAWQEFGWLWPLAVWGVLLAWRSPDRGTGRPRASLLGLLAVYAPLLLFHVWYPFLKLRDLLSLLPALAALSALGGGGLALRLWRRPPDRGTPSAPLQRQAGGLAGRLAVLGLLFGLGLLRLEPMLRLPAGFYTFGGLMPEQRRSLEGLQAFTPSNAVIACSLNSGAVELYGRRAAVRPGNLLQPGLGWTDADWLIFARALLDSGRPLYLLMDSPEMQAPLQAARALGTLTLVAELDVPVFHVSGGSLNQRVPLYAVTR